MLSRDTAPHQCPTPGDAWREWGTWQWFRMTGHLADHMEFLLSIPSSISLVACTLISSMILSNCSLESKHAILCFLYFKMGLTAWWPWAHFAGPRELSAHCRRVTFLLWSWCCTDERHEGWPCHLRGVCLRGSLGSFILLTGYPALLYYPGVWFEKQTVWTKLFDD